MTPKSLSVKGLGIIEPCVYSPNVGMKGYSLRPRTAKNGKLKIIFLNFVDLVFHTLNENPGPG